LCAALFAPAFAVAAAAPTASPSAAPAADPGKADAEKTDPGKTDAGTTDAGKTDSGKTDTRSDGASRSASAPTAPPKPAPTAFVYTVIVILAVVGLGSLAFINYAIFKSNWSLAEALSEPEDRPVADPTTTYKLDAAQKPILAPTMTASTSRLIALFGLYGVLMLYIGFGTLMLYYVGTAQPMPPSLADANTFLLSGLTLFAPYVVNKFASVFKK
jgi:hypothetical protein